MMKTPLETVGLKPTSFKYWVPHRLVGVSSLFFGFPVCALLAVVIAILTRVTPPHQPETKLQLVLYSLLCFGFFGVIITSFLADYVYIQRGCRSWFGRIDILWASSVFVLCNVSFGLRAGILEMLACSGVAVAAFVFSGASKSSSQWVVRHTLWHFVGGCVGSYGALRRPPNEAQIQSHYPGILLLLISISVAMVTLSMIISYVCVPRKVGTQLYQVGARYANWKKVCES